MNIHTHSRALAPLHKGGTWVHRWLFETVHSYYHAAKLQRQCYLRHPSSLTANMNIHKNIQCCSTYTLAHNMQLVQLQVHTMLQLAQLQVCTMLPLA